MGLSATMVGRRSGPFRFDWEQRDVMLYALSVGAAADGQRDLQLATENSTGQSLQVLPSFGAVMCHTGRRPDLGIDMPGRIHVTENLTLHAPLASSGSVSVTHEVTDIIDKGSAALVETESVAHDIGTCSLVATVLSTIYVPGAGGFGGRRGSSTTWALPDRPADFVSTTPTTPIQALLYRLNGDRNPLHSDPQFALAQGYPRPILHGLCTYGIACRSLVEALCNGDANALSAMSARFARPVLPGEELAVRGWLVDGGATFAVFNNDGDIVLSHGAAAVGDLATVVQEEPRRG